ncbi:MAG: MerR family transcriptional regulator, partial [Dehalococcoidales bacterium]
MARRASVSIRTVRFYEEKGLLEPSAYTSGGIRLYTARDVNRLIFVRRLTTLGMTLEEVKTCLGERPEGPDRKPRVERTLELLRMQKEMVAGEK